MQKFCRSIIYVITIVKFNNSHIWNLFNFLQQIKDFCKVISSNHFVIISLRAWFWMIMSATVKILNFTLAVRGFRHCYQKIWSPKQGEILNYYHERDNAFDVFEIKAKSKNGFTVGHLSREVSRITKFILDWGVKVNCISHIYEFSSFSSGSRRSGNRVRSYCKNASNDKEPTWFSIDSKSW